MLAIDAARTSGFRDSLYYFRRNPLAFKLNATQPEKDYLISIGKLGSHLRTRSVTLVTARSAFKLHGAKTILGTSPGLIFVRLVLLALTSSRIPCIDGKWVVDDYYEDKVLAEITAKGLKAGDPVGELADPNAPAAHATASALDASGASGAGGGGKGERGSGLGLYRSGGPTTIFGGAGWGPYSDGPLNAVRKSLLNREGLDEENWMLVAAQRTAEANASWARLRRKSLKPCGGVLGVSTEKGGGLDAIGEEDDEGPERKKRKKVRTLEDTMPLGVYEPHAGVVLCKPLCSLVLSLRCSMMTSPLVHLADRTDTQPTRARWEGLPDDTEKRQVLGGSKAGNGAWALAWVDTVMELPAGSGDSPVPAIGDL